MKEINADRKQQILALRHKGYRRQISHLRRKQYSIEAAIKTLTASHKADMIAACGSESNWNRVSGMYEFSIWHKNEYGRQLYDYNNRVYCRVMRFNRAIAKLNDWLGFCYRKIAEYWALCQETRCEPYRVVGKNLKPDGSFAQLMARYEARWSPRPEQV